MQQQSCKRHRAPKPEASYSYSHRAECLITQQLQYREAVRVPVVVTWELVDGPTSTYISAHGSSTDPLTVCSESTQAASSSSDTGGT
jgi:hypothetical protein